MLSAAEIMRLLDLKPHPEGGHFRETFRDPRMVDGSRAASTAAYYLLARGERSHWHKVDAVEVWRYHAGAPLKLEIALDANGPVECYQFIFTEKPLTIRSRTTSSMLLKSITPRLATSSSFWRSPTRRTRRARPTRTPRWHHKIRPRCRHSTTRTLFISPKRKRRRRKLHRQHPGYYYRRAG